VNIIDLSSHPLREMNSHPITIDPVQDGIDLLQDEGERCIRKGWFWSFLNSAKKWTCQERSAAFSSWSKSKTKFSVETNANSFLIDGTPRLLRGGTIQWFRLPPEVWEDRIKRFIGLGYNTGTYKVFPYVFSYYFVSWIVDMYVGWRNHEPEEGKFDWTTYDIKKFLNLCQKYKLFVCKY
jgi:hypothetical protein